MKQNQNNLKHLIKPIEKIPHEVQFGKVKGPTRGEKHLMNPPLTKTDNQYYLRDDKRKKDDVKQIVINENAYFNEFMKDSVDLKEQLFQEIKSRKKEDYETIPVPKGEGGINSKYLYFKKTFKGKGQCAHQRINRDMEEKEELILDENVMAEGKEHCDIGSVTVSEDHMRFIYEISYKGDEIYDIHINDFYQEDGLLKQKSVEHKIPKLWFGGASWFPDNKRIFQCTHNEETQNFDKLFVQDIETQESKLIFEEKDVDQNVSATISEKDNYFIVYTSSTDTKEVYLIDINDKEQKLNLVQERKEGLKYQVCEHEDYFIYLTNKDECKNFKICQSPKDSYTMDNWKDMFAQNKAEYIDDIDIYKDFMTITKKAEGMNHLTICNQDKINKCFTQPQKVPTPHSHEVQNQQDSSNQVYDTPYLRYTYSTPVNPIVQLKYTPDTNQLDVLREKEVPNQKAENQSIKRIQVPSQYGAKVPVSILWNHTVTSLDKINRMKLTGQGAQGSGYDLNLDTHDVCLLDRGVVKAIAHVRGGDELGQDWQYDGKMQNKLNTFLDFNNVAEQLVNQKQTSTPQLICEGGSAGGLLVGASMVLRPDLQHAVVLNVPFVDLLNTMCDSSIPLTTMEWLQWGNPNTQQGQHQMQQQCPQQNIRPNKQPHTLGIAGQHDTRVNFWEILKFNAKLRDQEVHDPEDPKFHLVKCDLDDGHMGSSDRQKYWRDDAEVQVFQFKMFGLV